MIFQNKLIWVLCISPLVLAACGNWCRSGHHSSVITPAEPLPANPISPTVLPTQTIPSAPVAIPPGRCRLVAKVLAVLPTLDPDKATPCGQVPCRARVQIQQILGYGSAFGKPLNQGQAISAYFNFTLSPSTRFFPALTTPLPGLQPGQNFQADVARATADDLAGGAWIQVYTYALLN